MKKERKHPSSVTTFLQSRLMDNGMITILLFVLASIIAGIVGHISTWGMLKYLYITLSAVFLPGWLLQQHIKISLKDGLSIIFMSFALGVALSMLIYACLLFCNIQKHTAYVFYGISILSIVFFVFFQVKKETCTFLIPTNTKDIIKVSVLLSIVFVLAFILFQMSQRSALYVGYQNLFHDSSYWFKNCVASTQGYPLPELSVYGVHLFWHLFSCFYVAMLHFCTGIELYELCFSLSYLWNAFLMVGAVYVVLNETLENKRLVYFGCTILLFVTGFEKQLCWSYIEHMYQCKLGMVEGFALSLYSYTLFVKTIKSKHILSKEFVLALIFFAAATGTKVPYACILLIGIGFIYLCSFNKQNWWKIIIAAGCFLCIFALVAKTFIIDGNALVSDTSNHKLSLSLQGSALLIPKMDAIYTYLSQFIGNICAWIIVTGAYILGTNYVVMGLFFFTLAIALLKKKYKDIQLIALFLMILSGWILGIFLKHPGRSQIYFTFVTIPYATLFALIVYENCEFRLKKISLQSFNALIIFSFAMTILFAPQMFIGGGTWKVNKYPTSMDGNDVTRDEIIAMQWVRDRLPKDIVLVTNKVLAPEGSRSFVTSAYTERQIYIEGYKFSNLPYAEIVDERLELLSAFFYGEEWAKNKLITEEGVSHVALYKAFKEPQDYLGNVLYENSAMVIYELK